LELTINPVTTNGVTTGISVIGRDVTTRKAAEVAKELAKSNITASLTMRPRGLSGYD